MNFEVSVSYKIFTRFCENIDLLDVEPCPELRKCPSIPRISI